MAEENSKAYYAIIPANIRYNENICANAKLLYGEITALCNEKGYCWATNEYFASLYNVSKVSISKWISSLVENGYIQSDISYRGGTKEILNRYLRIVYDPIKEKFNTPIKEKFKENNTVINNTINNKENIIKEKFIPPTLDEVQAYCKERNNNVDAKKFFDYFSVSGWIDSKGKKVKSWKQKVITWEDRQNGTNKRTTRTYDTKYGEVL